MNEETKRIKNNMENYLHYTKLSQRKRNLEVYSVIIVITLIILVAILSISLLKFVKMTSYFTEVSINTNVAKGEFDANIKADDLSPIEKLIILIPVGLLILAIAFLIIAIAMLLLRKRRKKR
ncbi:MAG: hypothetical protein AABW75_04745 [Nanoarchaeota archaeon]|mgnify:CR=1 FL=1